MNKDWKINLLLTRSILMVTSTSKQAHKQEQNLRCYIIIYLK